MSMARHASPDNLAIQHVQRCEQCGGAVALVIVGHGTGTPLLHGQSWLSAVEGLDLALFVDAGHQRPAGWIEIEPNHVLHLGREVLVARDFERFDQMRLEPVLTPYPLDTAVGEPCRRSHAVQAPGRIRRLRMQRHVTTFLTFAGANGLTRDGGSHPSTDRPFPLPRSGGASDGLSAGSCPQPPQSPPVRPSLASNTIRALQTAFCGVFRSRTNRSNRSRSAALIPIRSIFLMGADLQVRPDL